MILLSERIFFGGNEYHMYWVVDWMKGMSRECVCMCVLIV